MYQYVYTVCMCFDKNPVVIGLFQEFLKLYMCVSQETEYVCCVTNQTQIVANKKVDDTYPCKY